MKEFEKAEGFGWGYASYYKIYHKYPKYSDLSKYNFEIFNPVQFNGKITSYISKIVSCGKYEILCDSLGHGTYYKLSKRKPYDMSNKYFNSLLNKYKEYSNNDIERNAIYLDSIYKFCSKNNIRLILLTVPCWHEYLSMIDKRRLSLVYDNEKIRTNVIL